MPGRRRGPRRGHGRPLRRNGGTSLRDQRHRGRGGRGRWRDANHAVLPVRAHRPSLGRDLRALEIYDEVLNADVLINVPIAKHHSLARLTLGMKNLMGVIRNRSQMHQAIGQRLADLASRVRPALTVVDAVRMLMAHGPSGGSLADVRLADTLILSTDIVAADSYAATLFGLQPEDLSFIRAGREMGLGQSSLGALRIEELAVEA